MESFGSKAEVTGKKRVGALFTFPTINRNVPLVVDSKVGISWISTEAACKFVDKEIPNQSNAFEYLVYSCAAKWNEVLSKVVTSEA